MRVAGAVPLSGAGLERTVSLKTRFLIHGKVHNCLVSKNLFLEKSNCLRAACRNYLGTQRQALLLQSVVLNICTEQIGSQLLSSCIAHLRNKLQRHYNEDARNLVFRPSLGQQ